MEMTAFKKENWGNCQLNWIFKTFSPRFKLVPLHSSLSSEEQNSAFIKPKEGVTKVVIATNIAETSITIDDVVFVIDVGKMKEKRYVPLFWFWLCFFLSMEQNLHGAVYALFSNSQIGKLKV